MTQFHCISITTETAKRFRRTGLDDNGNQVRRIEATEGGGFPCRHCLAMGGPGEMMLLGSYNLPRPRGIYWTPSPVFVHERDCARSEADNVLAPIVRANPLVSVRAYDAADQCIYDLGHVCAGDEVDGPLDRAIRDPRTAFVNIHTARPGCLLMMVQPGRAAQIAGPARASPRLRHRGAPGSNPGVTSTTVGVSRRRRRPGIWTASCDEARPSCSARGG